MALKVNVTDSSTGLSLTDAYFTVYSVMYNKKQSSLDIFVRAWQSKEAKDNGKDYIGLLSKEYFIDGESFNTYFTIEKMNQANSNLIKQCYLYLKTLTEYANSADI